MPSLLVSFGLAVRRLRTAAGHSQESFADAIGVHRNYIGTVERGETNISLENIGRIAAGLKQPVSALFQEIEVREKSATRDVTSINARREGQSGTPYKRSVQKSERNVAERRVMLRQHVAELLTELNKLEGAATIAVPAAAPVTSTKKATKRAKKSPRTDRK
jgi:transcriptional regulator with XRE-family HTH domain